MNLGSVLRSARPRWAGPLAGPLGRRLLAGVLLLSLLPLVVSNGLGYLRSTTIIEGLVERYLDGIADLQGLHVSDQLERHTLFLRKMATHEAVRRVAGAAASSDEGDSGFAERSENPFLRQQIAQHPGFEALYVFTSDGEIIASAPLPPADLGLHRCGIDLEPFVTALGLPQRFESFHQWYPTVVINHDHIHCARARKGSVSEFLS